MRGTCFPKWSRFLFTTPLKFIVKRPIKRGAALAITLIAVLVGVGIGLISWRSIWRAEKPTDSRVTVSSGWGHMSAPEPHPDLTPSQTLNLGELRERIRIEAQKMGSLDENPGETTLRLKNLANAANEEGLKLLFSQSLDKDLKQDERFLSAMLLAIHQGPGSLPLLEKLATTPFVISDNAHDASGAIEWMVRAQAIEGYEKFTTDPSLRAAARSSLERVAGKMSTVFLQTRARQVLEAFKRPAGTLPTIEERDQKALKEIIQK